MQDYVFRKSSRGRANPPMVITHYSTWRVPSAIRSDKVGGEPLNPLKLTALLLTNPRVVNMTK